MPKGVYVRSQEEINRLKLISSSSRFKKGYHPLTEFQKNSKKPINAWKFQKGHPIFGGIQFEKGLSGEKSPAWKGDRKIRIRHIAPRPKPNFCEVCGLGGRICYDHDHETGKFRGWICLKCNSALGLVGDNEKTLLSLVEYLRNSH